MSKNDVINFAPTGEKKRKKIPTHISVIIIICILAFFISVFAILAINDFDINRALGARSAENVPTTAESVTQASNQTDVFDNLLSNESENFLIFCSDKDSLVLCQIVNINPKDGQIKINPLPLELTLKHNDTDYTIQELFGNVAFSDICKAFNTINIPITRYIHLNEDNFKRLMSIVGSVDVTVNGNYEFNVDAIKYTFSPGIQKMTSDVLFKFLKFATTGDELLRLQGETIACVFREHFTLENLQKGESFFAKLINNVQTDITAFDYNDALPILNAMLSNSIEVSVIS